MVDSKIFQRCQVSSVFTRTVCLVPVELHKKAVILQILGIGLMIEDTAGDCSLCDSWSIYYRKVQKLNFSLWSYDYAFCEFRSYVKP